MCEKAQVLDVFMRLPLRYTHAYQDEENKMFYLHPHWIVSWLTHVLILENSFLIISVAKHVPLMPTEYARERKKNTFICIYYYLFVIVCTSGNEWRKKTKEKMRNAIKLKSRDIYYKYVYTRDSMIRQYKCLYLSWNMLRII